MTSARRQPRELCLHEIQFVHNHREIVARLGRLAEGELALAIAGAVAQHHVPIVGTIAVTVSAINGTITLWKVCRRGRSRNENAH